ncbi:MAG: lytic transglycosylase domain-containing protein [Bryobacteraceae bacterium]|nr:lytic transglycosylase domain-containing protein [Bryobacteraceae bacterium]
MLGFCCACGLAAAALAPACAGEIRAVSTVRADPRTGRLVRVVRYQTPDGRPVRPEAAVRPLVERAAREHQVDPLLAEAVIRAESGYNLAAVSPKGAAGLMQLMPATAARLGARDRFDPRQNVEAGIRLLKALHERFGDPRLALAAYNAGEQAVMRHGGIPPYRETIEYVRKVERLYQQARAAAPAEAPQAPAQEPPVRGLLVEADEAGRIWLRTR